MIGQLFTQDFLSTGIADTPASQAITDAEIDAFVADIKAELGHDVTVGQRHLLLATASERRK